MSDTMKKAWNIISIVFVVLIAVFAVALMATRLMGMEVYAVMSGSMKPTYQVGDLIYVKPTAPDAIEAGEVITFVMNEQLVVGTHRVTDVEVQDNHYWFHTKGDANDTPDAAPVIDENVLGVPVFSLPLLGFVSMWIQTPPGSYVAVAVCVLLLMIVFVPDLIGGGKRRKAEQDAAIEAAVAKALAEREAKENGQKNQSSHD